MTSAAQPVHADQLWWFGPSLFQVEPKQYTHDRKIQLKPTLECGLGDGTYVAQYCGHGKTKVAYLLTSNLPNQAFSGKVLKLTQKDDQEPELFRELAPSGICTQVLESSTWVVEYNSVTQPVGHWNAWVTDFATPLDKYLSSTLPPNDIKNVRHEVGRTTPLLFINGPQ